MLLMFKTQQLLQVAEANTEEAVKSDTPLEALPRPSAPQAYRSRHRSGPDFIAANSLLC